MEEITCYMPSFISSQHYSELFFFPQTAGVSKAREQASSELQMEKYARNQAEIQADALQAQCDQQLVSYYNLNYWCNYRWYGYRGQVPPLHRMANKSRERKAEGEGNLSPPPPTMTPVPLPLLYVRPL